MSDEQCANLFNPQKKKVQPGTSGEKSSGLGLSFCTEFVEALHGQIRVESTPGLGSCFILCLPITPRADEPVSQETTSAKEPFITDY